MISECRNLLDRVQNGEFERILLPAIMKAMLRNPEIILECVSRVISYLPFDLSKYAMDLGKHFSSKW